MTLLELSLCGVFIILLVICLALDPELLRAEVLGFLENKARCKFYTSSAFKMPEKKILVI